MTISPAHGHNDELIRGLGAALARIGLPLPDKLERLSGGANMESWRFNAGPTQCVLRRAPSAMMMADRLLDHHGEAALIQAAKAAGVTAPEVLVELVHSTAQAPLVEVAKQYGRLSRCRVE